MTVTEIINLIIQETGYDIAKLSEVTGIGIGPLYKMARGETKKISFNSATKINKALPQYSIEFLRGSDNKDKKEVSEDKPKSSIEEVIAEGVFNKLKPLLIGSQQNHQSLFERTDVMLELLQHLVLDNDELRDRLALMEKQMNEITKMHS